MMVDKLEKYIQECKVSSIGLEWTATFYSSLYLICILIPILLDILILTDVFKSIGFPIFSLFLSIIPYTLSKNIERIQSYRDLSSEFYNLKQDFRNKKNNSEDILKQLRLKLAQYNINPLIKYFVNKKYK